MARNRALAVNQVRAVSAYCTMLHREVDSSKAWPIETGAERWKSKCGGKNLFAPLHNALQNSLQCFNAFILSGVDYLFKESFD